MADPELVVGAFETVDNTDEDFETYVDGEVSHEDVVTSEHPNHIEKLKEPSAEVSRGPKLIKKGARCEVRFCPNTSEKLEEWEKETCTSHKQPHKSCSCPPPFQLYAFPSKRIANESRDSWIKILQEDDPSKGERWQPKSLSRICSRHFADGEPTNQNPMPSLYISKLLTDYSQIQPVNTFIYYVGETPSSNNLEEDSKETENVSKAVSWGMDGSPINSYHRKGASLLPDRNPKEPVKFEKCLKTGRTIGNWNGFRMYKDYSLECWKNFGEKFDCIIPSCKRTRFHNEAFLQVPLFPSDEITTKFIATFIYVLRRFGDLTDDHLRDMLHSEGPRLQICRHHFPSTGAAGESPYRAICNFVTSCEPSQMKPSEILEALTLVSKKQLEECTAIYNSFLLLRMSVSDMALLNRKEHGRGAGQPYRVGQPEHSEKYTRYLEMWKNDCFTDVLLICKDGRSVKAHKAYLSAISEFLRDMLLEHEEEEITNLFLIDYEFEDIINMLLFIYSGVHYNERESIDHLQKLLSDLGISIETSVVGEEVLVVRTPGEYKRQFEEDPIDNVEYEGVPNKIMKFDIERKTKVFSDGRFGCWKCNSVFGTNEELVLHETSRECQREDWPCESQLFKAPINHWKECVKCGETFEYGVLGMQEAKMHVMQYHPSDSLASIVREKKFSAMCDLCGQVLSKHDAFLLHRNLHHGIAPFRCQICNKPFLILEKLKKHKVHCQSDDRRKSCDICGAVFTKFACLEKHLKKGCFDAQSPEEGTQFECNVCAKLFSSSQICSAHMRRAHPVDPDATEFDDLGFRCKHCDLVIIDYFQYKDHVDQHKNHPCDHCGLLFMSKECVKLHIQKNCTVALRGSTTNLSPLPVDIETERDIETGISDDSEESGSEDCDESFGLSSEQIVYEYTA